MADPAFRDQGHEGVIKSLAATCELCVVVGKIYTIRPATSFPESGESEVPFPMFLLKRIILLLNEKTHQSEVP